MSVLKHIAATLCLTCMLLNQAQATVVMKPTPLPEAQYNSMLTGNYDTSITKPEQFLGFEVGQKTATPTQINALVNLWASESDKAQIVEYARTYEDRPLHYLVISSQAHIGNIDTIKNNIEQLSTPDDLSASDIKKLINDTPATAWMAYSIHGNESSGADSALALIYHLIASKDNDVNALLDNLVILVDPMMNPDGRARFTKQLEQNRSTAPNFDVQSLLHSGVWPFGRTNHYHFDLNRDFYYAVNPESRGRIKAINQWYPLLMIDAHEMGALDTFLMGPPREPINEHIAKSIHKWSNVFASQQAADFDKKSWPYYTGEWFENLYPGYSNYAEYKGAIHILYEQARTAEDGVRLENGQIRSYKKSVHHQFQSSLSNLTTLSNNRTEIFNDFVKNRKQHISSSGPYADKSYVVLPTKNHSRLAQFLELLDLQGIEYYRNTKKMTLRNATNHLGQTLNSTTVEAGAIVIPNRQYDAPLIAAILEFDAKIKQQVLLEERQKTLRDGSSVMYDATAWNLTMMYGLAALEVDQHLSSNLEKVTASDTGVNAMENTIAYVVDGASDASVGYAARLLEQGVIVRTLDKAGIFNDIEFSRGSVVVTHHDNPNNQDKLLSLLRKAAEDAGVLVQGISQGLGQGDLPDIGGSNFKLLTRPQIAMITQNGISPYDYGHIWHMIDTQLGIRHSHLSEEGLSYSDLRPYNVVIVPGRWYGDLSKGDMKALDTWVTAGGTLVVTGSSTAEFAKAKDFVATTLISESFEDAQEYNIALYKEWLSKQTTISNSKSVASHKVGQDIWYPWQNLKELKPMDKKQLTQWNAWTSEFMPSGAMVATRTDQKSWLTYGVDEVLPVLTDNAPLLMSKRPKSAIVRYGVLVDNPKAEERIVGWSTIPKGKDLYLRMSGLIWPEAAERISNAAYMTRDKKGNGQVIMMASAPNFRGATKGTARLLLNAIVYGPGLGSNQAINL